MSDDDGINNFCILIEIFIEVMSVRDKYFG